ncbi:hypothetical protein [Pseudoduganella lurida]|nr:hypothetical protein [Pseudoduganella lurida]
MKPSTPAHLKTARGHAGFAVWYALLAMLLLVMVPETASPSWWAVAMLGAAMLLHLVLGWGARRAHGWARSVTLWMCFPLLAVVPLGTLAAIQMISYCWRGWERQSS